ncbi:MAG: hypothetical protein V5A62_18555 [Haloarculaceae archaeon]
MSIDIGGIVRRGYERTVARNGLLFAAILFVVSILDAMFSAGVERQVMLIVGSIVFGITVAVGFVFLVIPGLFLLMSLLFWEVFVAVEDDNFVEGFRHSWALTGGRRLRVFALGVVVVFVAVVVSIAFAIPGVFLPRTLGFLLEQVGSALLGVFFLATVAETYNRLVATGDVAEAGPDVG